MILTWSEVEDISKCGFIKFVLMLIRAEVYKREPQMFQKELSRVAASGYRLY